MFRSAVGHWSRVVNLGDEMRLQKVCVVGIAEVGIVDVFVAEPVVSTNLSLCG